MRAGHVVANECRSNESATEQPDNLDGHIAELQDEIYKNHKKHALASTEAPTHKLDVLSKRITELHYEIDENHENNMLALTEWHTYRLDDQYILSTKLQDEMTKTQENWEHEYTESQRSKTKQKLMLRNTSNRTRRLKSYACSRSVRQPCWRRSEESCRSKFRCTTGSSPPVSSLFITTGLATRFCNLNTHNSLLALPWPSVFHTLFPTFHGSDTGQYSC
jgi:hypothetical protein